MLGSMLFTSVAAIAGARVAVPPSLRSTMIVILGVMLGSAFDPGILSQMQRWAASLGGLVAYILVCIGSGIAYLRLIARYDPATAFFTATPGGFNEMVMIGGEMGADDRTIAMSHSARVMLVVFTIPILFQIFGGLDPAARSALNTVAVNLDPSDWAMLGGCIIGAPLARLLKIPAAMLVGPMVLSAALHLAGLTDAKPPFVLVAAAQVIVGAAVGGRFSGVGTREIARAGLVAAGLTVLLLCLTVGFALAINRITGIGIRDLILAYSPGGLAEMSLVSLALGGDAAFVSTHHIVRIILIVVFAPLLFGMVRRLNGPPSDPGG
jgi:membrane AbrB-like protein